MLMNVWSRLHAAFLTRNASTFQDLLNVAVKMDLSSAATAAVCTQKVLAVRPIINVYLHWLVLCCATGL